MGSFVAYKFKCSMKKFFLNKCSNSTGPSIFGYRLKVELEKRGWRFTKDCPDYNICFSSGKVDAKAVNILRLDGLYYDTENTLGNTDTLNAPIKKAYSYFDKLIFQSKYGKELFVRNFGETNKPHDVIYNGVPSTFSPEGPAYKYPWDKTLVCSASWRAHKRLRDIVAGFNKLSNNSVGLAVLGECKEIIKAKNVQYFGNIPTDKLPFYLRGANAFVHLTWLDCCPNVVVEALACGLPVLCSDNGGTKELVGDSGIVLTLEPEYTFERVALYKPPVSRPCVVSAGMEAILNWKKEIYRPDFLIDNVAKKYIKFMLS